MPTITGCAPITKMPLAFFSTRLLASRSVPWSTESTLATANPPATGVWPPPWLTRALSIDAVAASLTMMPPQSPASGAFFVSPLTTNVPPAPKRLSLVLVKITRFCGVPSAYS